MNFESKIRQILSDSDRTIDKEQFINNLTKVRYKHQLKRSQTISSVLAICLIMAVSLTSYFELDQGIIHSSGNYYFSDGNMFHSEFDQDNFIDNDYLLDDLVIYIMEEEDDIWTAFTFLDEIEFDNFINYMEEES